MNFFPLNLLSNFVSALIKINLSEGRDNIFVIITLSQSYSQFQKPSPPLKEIHLGLSRTSYKTIKNMLLSRDSNYQKENDSFLFILVTYHSSKE